MSGDVPYSYPPAPRGDTVDTHHGEAVADPYRSLEDPDAEATVRFVAAQNQLSEEFLAGVPGREAIRARLTELWDRPRAGAPFRRGDRWFQLRNPGLANQPTLHVTSSPDDQGEVLLDPNLLSAEGTVAVTALEVSEDGATLAYSTSDGGSDWRTWHVRDVATGEDRHDEVEWSKFATVAWRHDGAGFYYTAMDPPAAGTELRAEVRRPRVMFHAVGTPQAADRMVFEAADQPEWLLAPAVTDDGRYLVVRISRGTFPEEQLRVLDLEDEGSGWAPLVDDFGARVLLVANAGPTFYLVTDDRADRQRVVAVELGSPDPATWREVVPESDDHLVDGTCCGGKLVLHYLHHASSRLQAHHLDGSFSHHVPLPEHSSLAATPLEHAPLEGRHDHSLLHFKTTSFTEPGAIWAHDVATRETWRLASVPPAFDPDHFVTQQVFVTSTDGARVPLFLCHRQDLAPTGEVPTLLYGYGGFGIPMSPSFTNPQLVFMERGGLLAVACLRGGGEYGRSWHDAGRLANKQQVFDDFCACSRWLASSGWTSPARTAIHGGSNGGLLVGACITQHPDLFGAAVAEVGVLDMLRYPLFTIGWAWTSDFGDPADPEQYRWLRAYSPLHNVRPGACYPPTLLMTGDHDDRVVPGHSLKFAATLQAAQAGEAPVLLRVETSAGHGLGKPTTKAIAERTDFLAFLEGTIGASG
jgi:prolyl oligopeptidase